MNQNGKSGESREAPSHREPIGMIGLGLLGSAIARRLLQSGYEVIGYDLDSQRRTALSADGVAVASSAADTVDGCDKVILSLPTTEIVAKVIAGISNALRPGQFVIDTTTGEPEAIVAVATELAKKGVHYLDATVAGSSSQAQSGDVLMLVGAREEDFAACQSLLVQLAREVHHIGPPGAGAKLKLVHNLILGLNRAVLAEGLSFARSLGLDAERTLDVLRASAAYSRVMDQKGQRMVSNNFDPEARLSQHLKDVRLMLEAGSAAGARLPLSETHRALLEAIEAAGGGTLDNSAIIRAFENGATDSSQAAQQEC
jgi:3-hydroxyisobutyrate dehydrogenase-like beta-hydroxyacid dehydrogenase